LLREILEVARDNRSFQMASIQQQNLVTNHLNRLNQWLTDSERDRQVGLRIVSSRIDRLRADLNRVFRRRDRQPIVVLPSEPLRSSPFRTGEQQIPVPQGTPGYPPGFVPQQGQPTQLASVPPANSSGSTSGPSSGLEYTPVIPPRPAGQ